MKKAILWFLTAVVVVSVSVPAAQAAYVQTGQICTPVYTWVQPCILPPPAPPVCPPPAQPVVKCPTKTPTVCPTPKKQDTGLQKKLNAIRREALKQLKCLERKLKGVGWVKVVAERDRWKSGRYVISITLARSDDRNYQVTIYQVTVLESKCKYQTFYVWDYDCEESTYEPDDYIGTRKELLEMLKDY